MKTTYTLPLFLLALSLLFACNPGDQQPAEDNQADSEKISITPAQFEAAGMQKGNPEKRTFSQTIQARGEVIASPAGQAKISSLFEGKVKLIKVKTGDQVKKGQLLCTIESGEFIRLQQEYAETRSALEPAKAEYERQKALLDDNVASKKTYLQAEADYKTLLARSESFQSILSMAGLNTLNTTEGQIVQEFGIYAPINGYITGVAAVTGLFTRSDQMLMELVDLNSLQLNISVYEKDLISLKTDQDIIFYSPNQTRQKYKGKVISYSRAIDPESRTITVIGNILPEHQPSLIHGLFVEAEIITGTRPVTALPDEAILTEAGNTMVLVQTSENEKEMVFLRKMVKTGESMQGFTEILNPEGLENVLIKGGYNLLTE
ncbi:hypothetical protein SDC9_29405 [bioreactor metagenome]|uniref:CzcB-like barrel-sandwich hybrid domain-containing protein n=1 Tax=bioreactor metagenome TaxID=1076179 RepID=A0A644UWQ1_9ZZZZ|nr:efflux RND transporter periplasmic adaptor subunit [Lentimicrobium sp.]MEA5110654.1 efflux RND transporter periplasmic adaptor subunit [Lentimicrobium sp.]